MITNTQIQKWNNYFNSLSPEQKRVAIAKDVIAQLNAKKIIPESGTYFAIEDNPDDYDVSLQKHLPKTQCSVCALGSLFYSHVKFNNKVTYGDYLKAWTSDLIVEELNNYFDFEQLGMIEYAFEGFDGSLSDDKPKYYDLNGISSCPVNDSEFAYVPKEFLNNLKYSYQYFLHLVNQNERGEDFRLYQIMNNIIRNNGTFVPTDLKIKKWKKTQKTQ